jgi:imidazolonepropionase-like amidohydrolase
MLSIQHTPAPGCARLSRCAAPLLIAVAALLGACLGERVEQRTLVTLAAAERGELVIHDVNVFDGVSGKVVPHRDVVVRGERIATIRDADPTLQASAGRRIVDGRGRTLLPGFVDTHVHLLNAGAPAWAPRSANSAHNLAGYLYAGVTTVYDLAGFTDELTGLRAQLDSGHRLGPRLFFSGPPATAVDGAPLSTIRAAFPRPLGDAVALYIGGVVFQVARPADAAAAIEKIRKTGVDFVKIMFDQVPRGSPQLQRDTFAALLTAAQKAKLKTFVHIGTPDDAVFAAQAGATVLAHMPYRGALTDEQAALIAKTGARVACTIAAWVRFADIAAGRFKPSALDREISPADLLATVRSDEGTRHGDAVHIDMVATAKAHHADWAKNAYRLWRAGVPLVIGSDSAIQGVYPGSSFHDELALLSAAGIDNGDLLVAATSRGAALLFDAPEFGRVAEGQIADLLLVQGDPVADITATRNIALVLQRGRVVDRHGP